MRAHVSRGSSSGAIMSLVGPAPATWLSAGLEPPRGTWLQLPPPASGQLWSRHVPHGSSFYHLAQGSSEAATCTMGGSTSCVPLK
jgi:hypothetical protein